MYKRQGWQNGYDSKVGPKLVKEMIERDVNHPSKMCIRDSGKRIVEGGLVPLGRETFLCEVSFQNGEPIFNPGIGEMCIRDRFHRDPFY